MEKGYIEVCGEQYKVVKTGRAQAEQVIQLTRWFTMYGGKALADVYKEQGEDVSISKMLMGVIDRLDADALLDLFAVFVGCEKYVAEECFDIAILVDVVLQVYNESPAVRRLVERFFSPQPSEPSTEESATTSDEPTDAPTTTS